MSLKSTVYRFIGAALPLLLLSGCGRPAVEPARPAPVPPLLTDKDLADVTADLRTEIPSLMKEARIPGLQIALIRDGRIAWHRELRRRDATNGRRGHGRDDLRGRLPDQALLRLLRR